MRRPVLTSILLWCVCSARLASANQDCPDIGGRFSIHLVDRSNMPSIPPAFVDVSELWKLNLRNANDGELEIRGDTRHGLSVFWKTEKEGVLPPHMPAIANSDWKFNKDYQCEDGWVVFSRRSSAFRNHLPGLYKGDAKIRIARDGMYAGLRIESTFSGHQIGSLFSYDSAHLDFPMWWSRKTSKDTIVLNTAAADVSRSTTIPESEAVVRLRRILNEKLLGAIILTGMADRDGAVTVTLKALHLSDLKPFEDRLRATTIQYQMKTEPIWTNNSYFLELLVKTPPL